MLDEELNVLLRGCLYLLISEVPDNIFSISDVLHDIK